MTPQEQIDRLRDRLKVTTTGSVIALAVHNAEVATDAIALAQANLGGWDACRESHARALDRAERAEAALRRIASEGDCKWGIGGPDCDCDRCIARRALERP